MHRPRLPNLRQRLLTETANPANQRHRVACWAILLLAEGKSKGQVARECSVHPTTVARWARRLQRDGIAGLLGQLAHRGRRSRFTEAHLKVLRDAALTSPRELGKPFANWTLERLGRHLSRQIGIGIRANYLGHLLRRMGNPLVPQGRLPWFLSPRSRGFLVYGREKKKSAINLRAGQPGSFVRRRQSQEWASHQPSNSQEVLIVIRPVFIHTFHIT